MDRKRINDVLKKWVPSYCILPLLCILILNSLIYSGTAFLTADRFHFDFTNSFDRMVPLLPGFVYIYLLAFPFWAVSYIIAARPGKKWFYRFVAADLSCHLLCLLIFLILPTTNIRPEIAGNTCSERILLLIYRLDGGDMPSNLFPSIHCFVSWMCCRGLKGGKDIPRLWQRFSFVFAVLIIISTQVLKQHYIVDAVFAVIMVEFFWRFYGKESRSRGIMCFFERLNGMLFRERGGNRREMEAYDD